MRKEDRIRQQQPREPAERGSERQPEPRGHEQEQVKGRATPEPQTRAPRQPGKIPLPD